MDARIGQLMRNGAIVHYAYVSGFGAAPVEGTLEHVEVALGLRAPFAPAPIQPVRKVAKRAAVEREYIVHIAKRYPAWYEVDGSEHRVTASSAKEAVSMMRKEMARIDAFSFEDGAITYKARRAD